MAEEDIQPNTDEQPQEDQALEGGAYEVLRKRLQALDSQLVDRLEKLNSKRKETFGGMDSQIIGNERIHTDNNCIPRDLVGLGHLLIFGYNVFIGLKTETKLTDVFAVHRFDGAEFQAVEPTIIGHPDFIRDFHELYKYYKNARFLQFVKLPGKLLIIFQAGDSITDHKIFRFRIERDESLVYIDDRGDVEYKLPAQHDFRWTVTTRDDQVIGAHPHVSIRDQVFVETIGGDLTIKIEDNTRSGEGIYAEPVEDRDQSLDDAFIAYAEVGDLILLKILPYREIKYRYIVFNSKDHSAVRIDSIEQACIQLPEGHGIIFPKGYYLQNGVYRQFDEDVQGMVYRDYISSPNGEDYLYVFYHREHGRYILLQYNLISKEISNPVFCHGKSLYEDGKMVLFTAPDQEPRRNHPMQIWQTPFYGDAYDVPLKADTFLTKVGNRDLVRGISEGFTISRLVQTERATLTTYEDLITSCTNMMDGYHWLAHEETFNVREIVVEVKSAGIAAIDEYEKVLRIKQNTAGQIKENQEAVRKLTLETTPDRMRSIDDFVNGLSEIRSRRGKVISLRELRYADLPAIEAMDQQLERSNEDVSIGCVDYLLLPDSLNPYIDRNQEIESGLGEIQKVAELKDEHKQLEDLASRLDLLTDIVNNLNIEDATKTTQIVDAITDVYSGVNRTRAQIRNLHQDLGKAEARAEFAAQYKLLSQSITNYIGMCDSVEKCDEFLTKLMITIEELEGRFSDFEEFAEKLAEKREEAYNAFSNRKQVLDEEQKRKVGALISSAERILKGIINRAESFSNVDEVNAYFASDLMVSKLRDIIKRFYDMDESVKADDFSGRLKSTKDEILRRLRDKLDLFEGGDNVISFGDYKFTVNTQKLELTTVLRDEEMLFHLTGTDYYEEIRDEEFLKTRELWRQEIISENRDVYRGEYLAYKILMAAANNKDGFILTELTELVSEEKTLLDRVRAYSGSLYNEGYDKGIHDCDATKILQALIGLYNTTALLRYDSESRAFAILFWCFYPDKEEKLQLRNKLRSFGALGKIFEFKDVNPAYVIEIRNAMGPFFESLGRKVCGPTLSLAAEYLYNELQDSDLLEFTINALAQELHDHFFDYLAKKGKDEDFRSDIGALNGSTKPQIDLIHDWVSTYVRTQEDADSGHFVWEVVALIAAGEVINRDTTSVTTFAEVDGLLGQHRLIGNKKLKIHFDLFLIRLKQFAEEQVPLFQKYQQLRTQLTQARRKELRLSEFEPKVMGSFVRNKLINDVYLNLVGANFAKQMGAAGDSKRTDLMGMLLLISPPGYGKTTLMEYIASRLGLTFIKINGPAIGHAVTSLDPAEATNATAREELQKLNLAFEMGNNIMIYLDDIQHCNPELLQKFISLCDGQRKIEGVYKGKTKTYNLRGKKVSVVMAGNPYTESGDKFQIPDMLANRADTYNLGDISSTESKAFEMSFIENAMTSNPVLSKISSHGHDDIYRLMQIVETGSRQGVELEHGYSSEEVTEIVNVLSKLFRVRDVVLRVNQEYIYSAAQEDDYRTEPPFRLQGSYRNMNRIAEKIFPVMTDKEVERLILDSYYNEAQTLTSGAESNLLKFKEIIEILSEEEKKRWSAIKSEFNRRQSLAGMDDEDDIGKVLSQLSGFNKNLGDMREVIAGAANYLAQNMDKGFNQNLKIVVDENLLKILSKGSAAVKKAKE